MRPGASGSRASKSLRYGRFARCTTAIVVHSTLVRSARAGNTDIPRRIAHAGVIGILARPRAPRVDHGDAFDRARRHA
jgi:hypothetical protein